MDGWLRQPGGLNCLRFHRDPVESYWCRYVFVDKGEPIEGQPALLKTRKRVQRDQAIKEWKALIKAGWTPVEPQW